MSGPIEPMPGQPERADWLALLAGAGAGVLVVLVWSAIPAVLRWLA